MIIENIRPIDGQHCETTTTGTMLRQLNINLSEPMLFGLGEGLGFYLWDIETMLLPFISGRVRPEIIAKKLARNLKLKLTVSETVSQDKAWSEVKKLIDNNQIVGLKLDCFYLGYFKRPYHFAEHFVAMYGYDETYAFLVDTTQQGGKVKTSLQSFATARAQKGPMGSDHLHFILDKTEQPFELETVIVTAIKNNAANYLQPANLFEGNNGVHALSSQIIDWFTIGNDVSTGFKASAKMMEKAGTGGALFRNLYRDFLKESYELLQKEELKNAYEAFVKIAKAWNQVSDLFLQAAETNEFRYIQEASEVLKVIAESEKNTMGLLAVTL
jgi:hypothetical protein